MFYVGSENFLIMTDKLSYILRILFYQGRWKLYSLKQMKKIKYFVVYWMLTLCQTFRSVKWDWEWLNNMFKGIQLLSGGTWIWLKPGLPGLWSTNPWVYLPNSLQAPSHHSICVPLNNLHSAFSQAPAFEMTRSLIFLFGCSTVFCFFFFFLAGQIYGVSGTLCVKLVFCVLVWKLNHIYSSMCLGKICSKFQQRTGNEFLIRQNYL